MINQKENYSGFQGSETTHVECRLYQHGDDPVILTSQGTSLTGNTPTSAGHSVIAVQTHKDLGSPSGTFTITLKPSRVTESLFATVIDDDWIDITFYRFDKPWHVMRGLVDEIRELTTVGGSGATTTVYTISGRDFGKIWELTPVWFNPYAAHDLIAEGKTRKIFEGMLSVIGTPAVAVQSFLEDFLEVIGDDAGSNFNPPKGMPGIFNNSLLQSLMVNAFYFKNQPPRINYNLGGMVPQGSLWELAKHYSDPMFTELYIDLLPEGDPYSAKLSSSDPIDASETIMTAVLRDKPFPSPSTATLANPPVWDKVPVFSIRRQELVTKDVGRSGYERFNTYFTAGLLTSENFPEHAITLLAPLYDSAGIKRHGMRRMDWQSSIMPDPSESLDVTALMATQRQQLRDWYCLNPYMLSGTLELGHGRPDIKIGCRVEIPSSPLANNDEKPRESYYVESVDNVWQFGTGMRTILGVTRGWWGDDSTYMDSLDKVISRYAVADIAEGLQ